MEDLVDEHKHLIMKQQMMIEKQQNIIRQQKEELKAFDSVNHDEGVAILNDA